MDITAAIIANLPEHEVVNIITQIYPILFTLLIQFFHSLPSEQSNSDFNKMLRAMCKTTCREQHLQLVSPQSGSNKISLYTALLIESQESNKPSLKRIKELIESSGLSFKVFMNNKEFSIFLLNLLKNDPLNTLKLLTQFDPNLTHEVFYRLFS